VPAFDLTITYDDAAVRAAARVLFARFWRRMLPWTAGALLSLLVGAILLWYVQVTAPIWFLVLVVVADGCLWAYTRWNMQRRLMKRLGKSARIRLTTADFTISSEGESHTFPWTRFRSTLADEHNLYLFVSKTAAFVVPTRELPLDARQFVISHVNAHAAAF
jgi:hypothetical protein